MGAVGGALACLVVVVGACAFATPAAAQQLTVDTNVRHQVIDGFGTTVNGELADDEVRELFFDDLGASIVRWDLSPRFVSPYSDSVYYTPWFGSAIPFPGPDGNNARTYTGPEDYSRPFAGFQAPIAVMGPDIDANVRLFDVLADQPLWAGLMGQDGLVSRDGVKVLATLFSPAPWLKTATGARFMEGGGVLPRANTPFPFVWNGNFAGGQLDVSDVPLAVFFDGVENTSALTQFARSTAAYLRAFQNAHGVPVYAVGIQNELNFEHYFYSCKYALAEQLAAALRVLRAELDRYPDLAPIRIIGPEDLLIDTPYALWQFGGGATLTHKNLRFLHELEAEPQAWAALDFVAVHGSPSEQTWRWWADGWQATPAGSLPAQVRGFRAFGKKSWMTETSGHADRWPTPSEPADDGALAVALAIHRALTVGEESAWLHWQFMDPSDAGLFALTDPAQGMSAPKYVAVKHFARFIRPGAERIDVHTTDAPNLYASGYVHEADHQLTLVLVNANAEPLDLEVAVPWGIRRLYGFSSDASTQFARDVALVGRNRTTMVRVPAHGVVTLVNASRRGW